MKKYYFVIVIICFFNVANAQTGIVESGYGEYPNEINTTECLSENDRQQIFATLQSNRTILENQNILKRINQSQVHPLFIWPVVKSPSSPLNSNWSISNHVDHNPNYPGQIQDYNCGTRSYDTNNGYNHKGVDIFTWPFTWHQFENNWSHVVVAANGIIIGKADGNFDMSCSLNGSTWNAVYIQHADGSVAWYGHLKKNSLTTKNIGDTVVAGEFLGVIGSSGNSTGPHLHFEVYNANQQLVDPYVGTCNNWTSSNDSWWLNQKPYQDPKINSVSTHSQVFSFRACPLTENVYYQNDFAFGAPVVISLFLADQLQNTTANIEIYRPDNSLFTSFNRTFSQFYSSSYWYWTFNSGTFDQSGTWKIKCMYMGQTVEHFFTYGSLSASSFEKDTIAFYPNPTNNVITISNKNDVALKSISVLDMYGKILLTEKTNFSNIDVSNFSSGVYFIQFESENGIVKKKFIKI